MNRDRAMLAACCGGLLVLGAMVGLWGAFLVPVRLFGRVEGLADVVAGVAAFGLGWLAAIGTGWAPAAAFPGLGILTMSLAAASGGPGGDLVIPGSIGTDPGIGTVGMLFLVAAGAGMIAAVLVTARRFRPT